MNDPLLMIPGPTNLPAEVREALSGPSLYHRGEEFAALLDECDRGLRALFGTEEPVLILSSSGTGGVEAAIVNTLSPGDRVLAIDCGKFGERIGKIAGAFGATVDFMQVEYGQAANPEEVAARLGQASYRTLLFVLNETSTGVKQDGQALARVAADNGAMTIVDCVSGLGGMAVDMGQAGYAAAAAGSQKALMLPPGLAFVTLSQAGQQAAATATMPRYYFDLPKALASLAKGQTPYTPNVNMIVALKASLRLITEEGLRQFQQRHRNLSSACRAAARAAGLELFAADHSASDVVTAIKSPAGLDSGQLVKRLRDKHNILISGGQDALKGKIFRVGHLGTCQLSDLQQTWEAALTELAELGHPADREAVMTALQSAYHD